MSEDSISKDFLRETEMILDLARWTSDNAPTMDVAFTRNRLEPEETARLDAWLGDDPERHMQWERMIAEADKFREDLKPLTEKALLRFKQAAFKANSSIDTGGALTPAENLVDDWSALATFIGLMDARCRTVVILSAFDGERDGVFDQNRFGQSISIVADGEIPVSKNRAGYRKGVALGDLYAAQNVQRMCIDQGIKAPKFTADEPEMFAWDRPQTSAGIQRVKNVEREHEFPNVFVIGLVSNDVFVRIYNERLRSIFTLRYMDSKGLNGLQVGVPTQFSKKMESYTKSCSLFDSEGRPIASGTAGVDRREFTDHFMVIARVTDDSYTYFILGGDSEPLTHFAGMYMKDKWPSILKSLPGLMPEDDFVKVYRVSRVKNYDTEKPALTPLISWIGKCPDRGAEIATHEPGNFDNPSFESDLMENNELIT